MNKRTTAHNYYLTFWDNVNKNKKQKRQMVALRLIFTVTKFLKSLL